MKKESENLLSGEVEVNESYFGGKRKGRRGRGAAGKVPVFGLLKRCDRGYAKIIKDASDKMLLSIIQRKVLSDSLIHRDCRKKFIIY